MICIKLISLSWEGKAGVEGLVGGGVAKEATPFDSGAENVNAVVLAGL